MSTVIKDLGAVSAYAYAVEKGYTGTEAEFAELMADYAEVGQRAEDAAESALNSKTAAQTAATTATNKASEATTAAQTATTKAGEAQTSAQAASSKASEASQSASQASGYAQTAETAKTDAQTAKTQAETARDNAVTAKTAAETAQGKAEDAQAAAESVAESIPSDYSQLSEDVSDLKEDLFKTVTPVSYDTGYIGSDGQAVTSDTNYKYCDYIKMQYASGTNVSFKVSLLTSRGMAFYDADKNFISAINGNNCSEYGYTASSIPQVITVPVPNQAVYARISQRSPRVAGVEDFAMTGVNSGNMPENVAKIPSIESKLNAVIDADEDNTESRKISVSFTNGGFITGGGTVSSHTAYSYSDYIFIGGLYDLKMPMYIAGTGASIVIFNSKKEVTRYFKNPSDPLGTELDINVADNEMYIRLSCYTLRLSEFYLITDKIADSIAKTFRTINGQDDVPFSKIIRDGGMMRIFNTIGVIGDSLSSGEMAYGNASGETTTEYTDMYQYSWIQYLARECGIKAFNFSQGGMNTENFLSGTGGQLAKFQNPDNKCQAYFIALGHNDYNYGVPVGTPSDINISDPTQNPNTYYGNYAHIIALIKQIQPNAKIFCVCMKSTHFAEYNVAIRYMPTVFSNVYVLDFETYYPLLESAWEYTQGHGNAMGYLNYSWQIGTFVDWIIRNNRTDFKYVQFIGTDYDQYIPTN